MPQRTPQAEAAFQAGRLAAHDGKDRRYNPYHSLALWRAWEAGYWQGETEIALDSVPGFPIG